MGKKKKGSQQGGQSQPQGSGEAAASQGGSSQQQSGGRGETGGQHPQPPAQGGRGRQGEQYPQQGGRGTQAPQEQYPQLGGRGRAATQEQYPQLGGRGRAATQEQYPQPGGRGRAATQEQYPQPGGRGRAASPQEQGAQVNVPGGRGRPEGQQYGGRGGPGHQGGQEGQVGQQYGGRGGQGGRGGRGGQGGQQYDGRGGQGGRGGRGGQRGRGGHEGQGDRTQRFDQSRPQPQPAQQQYEGPRQQSRPQQPDVTQQQQQYTQQQPRPPQQQPGPPQQQPGPPQQQTGPPQQQPGPPQQQPGPPQQQPGPPQQQPGPPQQQPGPPQQQPGPPQQQPGPPQQQQQHIQRSKESSRDTSRASSVASVSSLEKTTRGVRDVKLSPDIEIQSKSLAPGSGGRTIKVYTNHFELKLGKVNEIIHYDVAIEPDKPKRRMRLIMEYFRVRHYPKIFPAYDGAKNLYSPCKLPIPNDTLEDTVQVSDDDNRPRDYKVVIKKVNVISLHNIISYIQRARGNQLSNPPILAVNVLEVIMRHSLAMRNITVGNNVFSEDQGGSIIDLGGGMQMYRGSFQSVSLGWKPFLNIDVANKAFPKEMPVIDLITELFRNVNPHDPLPRGCVEDLNKFLRTLKVQYILPNNPASKKTYRVNGVDSSAREITFQQDQSSRPITVEEYYKTVKRLPLRFPNMPCLWVGSLNAQTKVRIPCEFCKVMPGQPVPRKLTAEQTRNMIRHCATNTDIRKDSIKNNLQKANYNRDSTICNFELSVSSEFEKIDARVLKPPVLKYGNNKTEIVRKGVWNASPFLGGKTASWTILNLSPRTNQREIESFIGMIQRIGSRLGMDFSNFIRNAQATIRIYQGREIPMLKDYFQKTNANIIFVIIPEQDKIYNYVKQASELIVGRLTQCVKAFTMYKKLNDATITNILLKVNAKLNGINHVVNDRIPMMDKPTIIFGVDVTHPSPDSRNIPSVAAVTASFDPKAVRYNILWRLQQPTCEIIDDLEAIVKEQLLYFYKSNNNVKPSRIIFFRDGVSDGQFQIVLNAECRAIRAACSRLEANYKPSITFIVVQKRHHTRLFPVDSRDSEDRNNNVPAGTCVDTVITLPTRQNFFLVSHASIQGVAKPTKYVVLWDDNDFSNNDLENLTYYLCHVFTRCNRSVSYPAPTYYAHLAAARAKTYIETTQINLDKLKEEKARLEIRECIYKDLPMFFV